MSAAAALLALGAGIATLGSSGRLLTADDRFLLLHGIDRQGNGEGQEWPGLLHAPECRLPADDAVALAACWSRLLETPSAAGDRIDQRLTDGRVLELAATATPGPGLVLVAKDGTGIAAGARRRIQSGLVHELNNALGGMLANLYLAASEVGGGHAGRPWIDAANQGAVELRGRLREIADAARSGRG